MKILYIFTNRAEEKHLLEIMEANFIHLSGNIKTLSKWKIVRFPYSLVRIIWQWQPDIILVETLGFIALLACLLGHLRGKPVAVRLKGDIKDHCNSSMAFMPAINRAWRLLNCMCGYPALEQADAILPVTQFLAMKAKKDFYISGKIIHYVPISIGKQFLETYSFRPATSKPTVWNLLSVTNFKYWEKVRPILTALPDIYKFLEEQPNRFFHIVGNGYFHEHFSQYINNNNKYRKVSLLGYLSNLKSIYQGSKLFLHLSQIDAMPNVVLEAFYHRLPVIMNQDCPARELVIPGYNGYLVDLSQRGELYNILKMLSDNPKKVCALGENARHFAQQKFSPQKVGQQLLQALEEVIAQAN